MKRFITILAIVGILFSLIPACKAQKLGNEKIHPCISCEQLKDIKLPDVTITKADKLDEESSHCLILGIIGREIKFELLLPDEWNNRFIMGGGGGFAGSIMNPARSYVHKGYATAGTDTGHEGKQLEGEWALYNMERQLNFGHLAIHRTAEVSKAIIDHYYGNYPRYSYFIGCSRGGGQGMMEAQRYPDDFDGIVAGAPAFNWVGFATEFIQNTQAIYPSGLNDDPVISEEHVRILHNEILKQCDTIDGVKDGIINNPTKCNFNFNLLPKCSGDISGKDCFTKQQIRAIKTIYDGVKMKCGISYPGFPFGGENKAWGWRPWITGPSPGSRIFGYPSGQAAFGIQIYKYLILQDPDWNYLSYDFTGYEKEIKYARAYLDATSTDYTEFKDHNGKIIIWHGWSDPAVSALATIEHYKGVQENHADIKDFMRLFLLPGVLHCGNGDGPDQVEWIKPIRDWVEKNNPPNRIIAKKIIKNKEVISRPIFPYPKEAIYNGSGNPDIENNWIQNKNVGH